MLPICTGTIDLDQSTCGLWLCYLHYMLSRLKQIETSQFLFC